MGILYNESESEYYQSGQVFRDVYGGLFRDQSYPHLWRPPTTRRLCRTHRIHYLRPLRYLFSKYRREERWIA